MANKKFESTFLKTYNILPFECDPGGFGTVYKVFQKAVEKETEVFIVKLVEPDEDKSTLERAQREVEVILHLKHENIIKIFESWVEYPYVPFEYPYRQPVFNPDGVLFIRMEFCDLKSLQRWLQLPQKKFDEAWILMHQITQGLNYLHSQQPSPIVHRDLKPANIVLKSNERNGTVVAKIVDFGLATELRSKMTSRLGTKYYISPEVTKPGGKYTEKADIYALGIMFCQMMVYSKLSCKDSQQCDSDFVNFMRKDEDALGFPSPFQTDEYLSLYPPGLLTPYEIKLVNQMTALKVSERICSEDVLQAILQLHPDIANKKILAYKYLEKPSEFNLTGSKDTLKLFRERMIHPEQAKILTHLTLSYVKITCILDFSDVLKISTNLTHLHLTVNLDMVHLIYVPVDLPKLKNFFLHQLNEDLNYEFDEFMNEIILQKMLFFGPLERIWENRMTVKVIYGDLELVNIDCDQQTFFLYGNCGLSLLPVLNNLAFNEITLLRMIDYKTRNSKYYTKPIDWNENPPACCEKLKVFDVPLDIKQGFLFSTKFEFLFELTYEAVIHTFGTEIFNLESLPRTIRRLHVGNVTLQLHTNRKLILEYLSIDGCFIPEEFVQNYTTLFEVEELRICPLTIPVAVTPNFELVEKVYETKWKLMRFEKFDWTKTEENREFAEYLIEELRINRIPVNWPQLQMEMINGSFSAKQLEARDFFLDWGNRKKASAIDDPLSTSIVPYVGLPAAGDMLEGTSSDRFKKVYFDGSTSNEHDFPDFPGISEDRSLIETIHIRHAIINGNSLLIQLRRCKELKTLILENIKLTQNFRLKCNLPNLKTYKFVHNEGDLRNEEVTQYFTKEKLLSFLFFHRKGIEGLWKSGINIYLSGLRSKVLDLTANEVTIQFLDFAQDILDQMGADERLSSLVLHRVAAIVKSIPSHLTRLNLTQVIGVKFNDIFQVDGFPNLKELFYEAVEVDIKQQVDLKCIQACVKLETLMIGGVTLAKLCPVTLTSFTILNCILPPDFEEEYVKLFKVQKFALIGGSYYIPCFKTAWPLLKTKNQLTCVIFSWYETSIGQPEFIVKCFKDRFSRDNPTDENEDRIQEQETNRLLKKYGLINSKADNFKLFRESIQAEWVLEEIDLPQVDELTGQNQLSDYNRYTKSAARNRFISIPAK